MENWKKDARRDVVMIDIDALVPQDHLLRKVDAGYKTPWISKKIIDDGKVPILPYTRYKGNKEQYKPWQYIYDPVNDTYVCPQGGVLRHTTTDRDGKRTYRSRPASCRDCPYKDKCGANEKGQKVFHSHIWQEYLDIVEQLRKTERGKEIYAQRKEAIERVFADAKEKHALRYTHHRGLAAVTRWIKLKFASMNLKKLAIWGWKRPFLPAVLTAFSLFHPLASVLALLNSAFFDRLKMRPRSVAAFFRMRAYRDSGILLLRYCD